MQKRKIFFNGIDPATGLSIQRPCDPRWLASQVLQNQRDVSAERKLQWACGALERGPDRRLAEGLDPFDLASAGWGVIFPQDDQRRADLRGAIKPLLDHRRDQATQEGKTAYREFTYLNGELKESFYRRYGGERGPAASDSLPYYLLIVGNVQDIPYRFQYLLDVQHGVGRITFDDLEAYKRYAESVVAVEASNEHHVSPKVSVFAPSIVNDNASARSERGLVRPLIEMLGRDRKDWAVERTPVANKAAFKSILQDGSAPALLFTSAHGLAYRSGHPLQRENQGAVVCQDWPGKGPVDKDQYFSASDIDNEARLQGLIAFMFGCYSVATPKEDNFPPEPMRNKVQRAPKAFTSSLAQRLLSHSNGGALAVLGHVDRTWTRTFGTGQGKGCRHVESMVKFLLDGYPVGVAMDWMNERYAELSTELSDYYDEQQESLGESANRTMDPLWISGLWRANNDARNFVVLGDPAVSLPTGPRQAVLGKAGSDEDGGAHRKKFHLRKALGGIYARPRVRLGTNPAMVRRQRRMLQ